MNPYFCTKANDNRQTSISILYDEYWTQNEIEINDCHWHCIMSYKKLGVKIVTKTVWCFSSSKMHYEKCSAGNENCHKNCMMFIQLAKCIMSYEMLGIKFVTKIVWCLCRSKCIMSFVTLGMKIVTKSVWCLFSSKMYYM